ncbi:hypothetical protein GCM10009654_06640 [Streptomyces hebeiensis]|uniref:Helix-turn-helix domain-containing protein n=1 Tax=Streptomyces hebeiensis TaxID=229486 RepID=A0ABN1UIP9_9ACTN
MRIHRTAPTRSFSTFANALLRDHTISWCAADVLMYLLSLPNGARSSIRSLAELRKEGRARIAESLRELEESRYLRRVVAKDRETGRFSTVYEVFDAPYSNGGDGEGVGDGDRNGRNLASGEGTCSRTASAGSCRPRRLRRRYATSASAAAHPCRRRPTAAPARPRRPPPRPRRAASWTRRAASWTRRARAARWSARRWRGR